MKTSLLSIHGRVSRKHFTIWGLILFGIKYNIDRLIALSFGKYWFISAYFMQPDHLSVTRLTPEEQKFYLILVIVSVPFIWLGVLLCLKRLRDISLPLWLIALFFIPLINILFFFTLCVLPGNSLGVTEQEKPAFLVRVIPISKTGSIFFSIVITVVTALLLLLISVYLLDEYGWGLFIAVPFFIGFCSVLLYSYHHRPVSLGQAIGIGSMAILIFALLIFVLAMEGIICIAMAAPFGFAICGIGSLFGYAVQYQPPKASLNSIAVYAFLLPALMWTEKQGVNVPAYELKTGIVVNQPPEKVWEHLITLSTIAPPEEFIFRAGIAYPVDAKITGKGVGAIRNCNFTTGSFIEPITTWDEPHLLQFDVLQQPQPMIEMSVYTNIHAPHLEGFFTSIKGQFKLVELNDHKTYLEGTTWYKNKMFPLLYWKQWSDFILHKIHYRVLNHIKQKAEN